MPSGAVIGGIDNHRQPTYIVRVHHNGAIIPGKLNPSHSVAHFASNGKEVTKATYEVCSLFNLQGYRSPLQ